MKNHFYAPTKGVENALQQVRIFTIIEWFIFKRNHTSAHCVLGHFQHLEIYVIIFIFILECGLFNANVEEDLQKRLPFKVTCTHIKVNKVENSLFGQAVLEDLFLPFLLNIQVVQVHLLFLKVIVFLGFNFCFIKPGYPCGPSNPGIPLSPLSPGEPIGPTNSSGGRSCG